MEFTDFLKELLHIDSGFCISHIERETGSNPSIRIYLEYQLLYCEKNGDRVKISGKAKLYLKGEIMI